MNELNSPIIEAEGNQSHRLLHMLPRGVAPAADDSAVPSPRTLEYYHPTRLELASREVARRVYAKAEASASSRLHKLLGEPPSSPMRAGFYEKNV